MITQTLGRRYATGVYRREGNKMLYVPDNDDPSNIPAGFTIKIDTLEKVHPDAKVYSVEVLEWADSSSDA